MPVDAGQIACPVMIDTLKLAKGLQEAGMSREQAEGIAEALREAQSDYVTKADLDLALTKLEARLDIALSKLETRLIYWVVGKSSSPQLSRFSSNEDRPHAPVKR